MIFSFSDHVALLHEFLNRSHAIVERVESRLLNVQGKEIARSRNRDDLARLFSACFFEAPGIPRDLSRVKGQLAATHLADGFEPVLLEETSHALDPLDLIVRAYEHWDLQRWPGRGGRLSYARVLFGVFMLRQLEALSLRIWDAGAAATEERLRSIQALLDRLNQATHPHVFVRDAGWLIQTAQGPLTRHLAPYFRIAEHISTSFGQPGRLEVHVAGAALAGGHLRSQLRYRAAELQRAADDPAVLAVTRNSNSMDAALLVRDLVPLLEAYTDARSREDADARLMLADAILQGLSADAELFLTRLDLLGPGTAIEALFVERGVDGAMRCTRLGAAHGALVGQYARLIGEAAGALTEDARSFDPAHAAYSPFGVAYGFCGDLLSNMAVSVLHGQPGLELALEDMFVSRVRLDDKRVRARGFERLPVRGGEREPFEHSAEWAGQVFQRTLAALALRAANTAAPNASAVASAHVFVRPRHRGAGRALETLPDGVMPAQDHCVSSDVNRAMTTGTTAFPRGQILRDRNEGRFLASAETGGRWFAVSKTILTEVIAQGRDALIVDVPDEVIDVLRVTCPDLIVIAADGPGAGSQ